MSNRDYHTDAAYKKFRYAVRKRDNKTCRWPNCEGKKKIQVHHILPWKMYPHLRYEVSNGICLCKNHHKFITGHEVTYAKFLSGLIK